LSVRGESENPAITEAPMLMKARLRVRLVKVTFLASAISALGCVADVANEGDEQAASDDAEEQADLSNTNAALMNTQGSADGSMCWVRDPITGHQYFGTRTNGFCCTSAGAPVDANTCFQCRADNCETYLTQRPVLTTRVGATNLLTR